MSQVTVCSSPARLCLVSVPVSGRQPPVCLSVCLLSRCATAEPAVVEDLHKYWQAALKVEVAPVAQKRVRSASPALSASSDADSAGADEANRLSERPQKRRRVESVASTDASPLVSLAAGGRVATPPARQQTAAQRLASFKRKLAKADQSKPRQTRASTARQSRVAKAKSLISVDSAATATVSLGVYPPAPLQMPLNGPRLFVRDAQIKQNPTLAVATQVGKCQSTSCGSQIALDSCCCCCCFFRSPRRSAPQQIVSVCRVLSQALDDRWFHVHAGCARSRQERRRYGQPRHGQAPAAG